MTESECTRCGLELDRPFNRAEFVRLMDAKVTGRAYEVTGHGEYCDACFDRIRVALDWALGGEAGPDAHAAEFWQNVACALEWDRGAKDWQVFVDISLGEHGVARLRRDYVESVRHYSTGSGGRLQAVQALIDNGFLNSAQGYEWWRGGES